MSGAGSTLARTSGHVPVTASGPPRSQLQPFIDCVEPCVIRGDAQRLVVYVDGKGSGHTQHQRRERQYARPCPHVEHGIRSRDLHFFFEQLETQRRRRVQPGAERRSVDQSEGARFGFGVSRNDREASDANRAWAEDPNGSVVAPRGRGHRDIVDVNAERARDLFRSDAVGHQGRDPAPARALDINRAELDEPIERMVGDVVQVYAIRHVPA